VEHKIVFHGGSTNWSLFNSIQNIKRTKKKKECPALYNTDLSTSSYTFSFFDHHRHPHPRLQSQQPSKSVLRKENSKKRLDKKNQLEHLIQTGSPTRQLDPKSTLLAIIQSINRRQGNWTAKRRE
jgi:hypothetical protein